MILPFKLTPRELEAMRVTLECYGSSKLAARRMGISRFTLRNYRHTAYVKAGVTGAVEFWSVMGWVNPYEPT